MTSSTLALGEFELVVLLAVLHLQEQGAPSYGSPVRDAIEQRGGRQVARGAVYITLDRLQQKGLVTSTLGGASAPRGNRPRRFFRLTPAGVRAVRASVALVERMRRGLEPILGTIA